MAERKSPHAPRGYAILVGRERVDAGYKPAQSSILRLFGQALYNMKMAGGSPDIATFKQQAGKMSVEEHKKHHIENVTLGVLTVSSTRTKADDWSGRWIMEQAEAMARRIVFYDIVPDQAETIRKTVLKAIVDTQPDILLVTGGTGLNAADVTIEAVKPLFEKELTAFGAIFASLSYSEIGSAALLSRATAGIVNSAAVFCMPGSLKACRTACNKLVFPEIEHITRHLREY